MSETTTIEIDKETHILIRQYCLLNNITSKELIKELAIEKFTDFKKKIDEMKKLSIKI